MRKNIAVRMPNKARSVGDHNPTQNECASRVKAMNVVSGTNPQLGDFTLPCPGLTTSIPSTKQCSRHRQVIMKCDLEVSNASRKDRHRKPCSFDNPGIVGIFRSAITDQLVRLRKDRRPKYLGSLRRPEASAVNGAFNN